MTPVKVVVDRIEGAVAVLEIAGTFVDVPLAQLPPGTAEGDELRLSRVSSPLPDLEAPPRQG